MLFRCSVLCDHVYKLCGASDVEFVTFPAGHLVHGISS